MNRKLVFTALFVVSTTTAMQYSSAQQTRSEPPGFISFVDGSTNPELIRDDVVYNSVAGTLVSTGPGSCVAQDSGRDAVAPAFSNRAPCNVVPGVDPLLAEQLGTEYEAFTRERSAALAEALCEEPNATRLRNGNLAELAAWLDAWEREDQSARVAFFETRGAELLGPDQFERLLSWANDIVRPGIRQTVIDTQASLEASGVTPERMLDLSCSFATRLRAR